MTSPLGDLLRLYRVRDWLHFLPMPLAGWLADGAYNPSALIGGVLGWGFGLAYTSAINQAFDDRLDRLSVGKNPVGASLARRQAVLLSVPPAVACLAVVAWLSPRGLLPALALLIAATVYSAPPRLKRVPLLATFWNVVIGLPGLFLAGYPDLSHGPFRVLVGLFAMLLFIAQLIHEARDSDDDRAGGILTIATLGGVQSALGAAAVCLLPLPAITWWLAHDLAGRLPLTLATALFAAAWVVVLIRRLARNDLGELRTLRMRYRYAAIALGAAAFGAILL